MREPCVVIRREHGPRWARMRRGAGRPGRFESRPERSVCRPAEQRCLKRLRRWVLVGCLWAMACAHAHAGAQIHALPELFTGVNAPQGGGVLGAVAFDGRQFFSTYSFEEGAELWVTDGSPAGTRLFADLCPGQCSGDPRDFQVIDSRLFFSAQDRLHGRELWVLEAGAAAPRLFADIEPGVDGSNPGRVQRVEVLVNGVVRRLDFVVAARRSLGRELWRVLPNGVRLEHDFRSGSASGSPTLPVGFGPNRLLTSAVDSSGQRRPMQLVYSGVDSLAQVVPVAGFPENTSTQRVSSLPLLKLGDRAYLLREGSGGGLDQLWSLRDGGAGAEIHLLLQAASMRSPVAVTGLSRVFFIAAGRLHVSDGTPAGTVSLGLDGAEQLVAMPQQLLLYARHGTAGQNTELFRSNGTVAGTALVREIVPGDAGLSEFGNPMVVSGDGSRVYLAAGNRLWASDGSAAGTVQLSTLADGDIDVVLAGSGRNVFVSKFGGEPHFSAGQSNDLRRLAEVLTDVGHAFPFPVDFVGQRLLFNARVDGGAGSGLQAADAMDLGNRLTVLPQTVRARRGVSLGPQRLLLQPTGRNSFVTDGLSAVQTQVTHPFISSGEGCGAVVGGGLILPDDDVGREIWRLDGSLAGSLPLLQLGEGRIEYCYPRELGDVITFAALGDGFLAGGFIETANVGSELLRYLPPAGLTLVADINPGPASSRPQGLERLGQRMLFSADDGIHGRELWVSDGTAQGTRLLLDIEPGAVGSAPHGLRRIGDRVVFAARTSQHGNELWATDGTAAGTVLLRDLYPGPGSGIALTSLSGSLMSPVLDVGATHALFAGNPGPDSLDAGCPVFITDGTPAGTHCAQDRALPLPLPSFSPAHEARLLDDGTIAFIAHNAIAGEEVHALSRRQVVSINGGDLRPGPRGSAPNTLLARGGQVWFGANDGSRGFELYRLDLSAIDEVFADGFE